MENNQLPLVTFEQAKRLKNAGFDWPTTAYYTFSGLLVGGLPRKEKMANGKYPTFFAPTVSLALKWVRDVKGIDWQIVWVEIEGVAYAGEIKPLGAEGMVTRVCLESTYESAENALLDELLTLIEK